MRIDIVDPSAYTPPYDHALCDALARAGGEVELVTSRFGYGSVPRPTGYRRREPFYGLDVGAPGSRLRRLAKLAEHPLDMARYRRAAPADIVHFQWLTVPAIDAWLLPRRAPLVVTAHDVLAREPRPGQRRAQGRVYRRADAVVVHSQAGRARLVDEIGVDPETVHVIRHGAFEHLTRLPGERGLPGELAGFDGPVVLCFGLMRPYKGIDVLLDAWRGIEDAELWIVGLPKMDVGELRSRSPANVRWLPRFVGDAEIPALFRRADLVVLPYREIDQSGVLFTALAFERPMLLSAVGGFPELADVGAARLVSPGDPRDLHAGLERLLARPGERAALSAAARAAVAGDYGWDAIAHRTLELYGRLRGELGSPDPAAVRRV